MFTRGAYFTKRILKIAEWQHIEPNIAKQWMNTGGNITLLSGAKNIEASNNPFDVKMSVYKGKGKYDDKDTKITAFKITQNVVSDYEKGTYDRMWNEKAIKDRWNWFCKEVAQILDVDTREILI
ncbi:DUF1524 domain-containing protein [Riemerella anatipestifer]|nr:DUF1524 domain-containing protein [Riemerella anatipestifer]